MDEVVTAAQAAQLTGLSERTIRRRIATNEIPARHVARNRYAIRLQDLPIHRPADELMARLQALEYRVRVLELQQQRTLANVDAAAAAPVEAAEGETVTEVGALLTQLAHEVRRLDPLITTVGAEPKSRERKAKSRTTGKDEVASDT